MPGNEYHGCVLLTQWAALFEVRQKQRLGCCHNTSPVLDARHPGYFGADVSLHFTIEASTAPNRGYWYVCCFADIIGLSQLCWLWHLVICSASSKSSSMLSFGVVAEYAYSAFYIFKCILFLWCVFVCVLFFCLSTSFNAMLCLLDIRYREGIKALFYFKEKDSGTDTGITFSSVSDHPFSVRWVEHLFYFP